MAGGDSPDTTEPLLDGEEAGETTVQVDELITQGHGSFHEGGDGDSIADERYCSTEHYSDRAPWLRAAVLGANDGLVSVASIMLGVGAASTDIKALVLSGTSALVAGAMSMAVGEYISVSSQKDTEEADVEKERQEQRTEIGRARELDELTQIYLSRGLNYNLAREVAIALTKDDVVRAHARDELGIDIDDLANPWQAALSSMICFSLGAAVPLLSGAFITAPKWRLLSVILSSTLALAVFGAIGAWLGGARRIRASCRVLVGGWLAFAITYGVGRLFGEEAA
jgi:VIT1/CCC1 family predicted Fe2+/Mn2+ transporter